MTKTEILKELLKKESLNAQQMAHYLNIYGDGKMSQGIKNVFFAGTKKGGIIGLVASGVVAVVMAIPCILTYKENRKTKKQNEELKQIIQKQLKKGELNEQTI